MKFLNTLLLCTLVAATSVSVFANNSDEWELIATKTVNFHTETDTVTPNSLFRNRSFSKIKLKCVQGTVDMNGLKVVMTDGSEKKAFLYGRTNKRIVDSCLEPSRYKRSQAKTD